MVRPTLNKVINSTLQKSNICSGSTNISTSPTKQFFIANNNFFKPSGLSNYISDSNSFQVGGTGSLYIARDLSTNNLVAIKVIPFKNINYQQSFENEINILSSTKYSSYIVKMKEYFIHQNRGYIVMELLSQDLYSRSEHFTTIDEVKYIFKQICKGVLELHKNNIAHLDLKPENILLDDYDNIKICDFGSSFQFNNQPISYEYVGSDFYLAPEIFAHHRGYNALQADIWSLGIMLHVMLTDSLPFDGISHEETLGNYFTSKVSLKELEMVCPNDYSCHSLIKQMLQKNPLDRPSISQILQHEWFLQNEMELSLK